MAKVDSMKPMLAVPGTHVPTGAEWSHEVKWDGMRVVVSVEAGHARLFSRNGNDVSLAWPEVGGGLRCPGGTVVDAELVVFDEGRPSFSALAERMHVRDPRKVERAAAQRPATLLIFDVLRDAGTDVCRESLADRRRRLVEMDLVTDRWQVPPAYDDGQLLWQATAEQGLEGIVSKRLASPYQPGVRSHDWLKFPHRVRGSYAVGGWRTEVGSKSRLGALLVGEETADGLVFRGRVGSGLGATHTRMLTSLLGPLERADSPFVEPIPAVDAAGTHWVHPVVVVEVESLGFTRGQRLRQPSLVGVRSA